MADDRTYIRLHDGMPGHPKVRGLSDKAFRTLIRAWCYCSEYLTDGEVVSAVARDFGTTKAWSELVSAGLAESAPSGYLMHDYLEHQRSADEVAEIKAGRGAGAGITNHIRWHVKRRKPEPSCEHCNPSLQRSDSDSQATSLGDRSPSHRTETETETETEEKNSSRGGSHVGSGLANDAPPLYPDHCPDHQEPVPPKCGGCQKQKQARRVLTVVADDVFERPPWCGTCNEYTRLIDSEDDNTPSRRCSGCHPLAVAS